MQGHVDLTLSPINQFLQKIGEVLLMSVSEWAQVELHSLEFGSGVSKAEVQFSTIYIFGNFTRLSSELNVHM